MIYMYILEDGSDYRLVRVHMFTHIHIILVGNSQLHKGNAGLAHFDLG